MVFRSLIIENKDYNYTLVITGTTFQIVHHDTNKNATYTHGIEVALCIKKLGPIFCFFSWFTLFGDFLKEKGHF
jgi:hypothetical protein